MVHIVLLQLCLRWLFLQTRNVFQIIPSYDNDQIKQHIIFDDQASTTTLFDVLAVLNVFFTPLYTGVNT